MKAQMRFQKYICLIMLIVGALATVYAFCYCSGALAELGQTIDSNRGMSYFTAEEGKYDALLYNDIQGFNSLLMYLGIVMIILSVLLYITSCNKRRNYYISNFVAIGACAGGNIIISVILLVMNGIWRGRFLNVDFENWNKYWEEFKIITKTDASHYSESTFWFDLGFAVYILVIVVSIALILNLVWKIKLMQGEKKLLNGSAQVTGGAV